LRAVPYTVTEVRSSSGQVLYRRPPTQQRRVAAEDRTQWMNAMLFDVVARGTGGSARVPGHEVAGKTGTTSDLKDAWFVGFSPELVTGVWVGNDDTTPMRRVTGGGLPAQIWGGFMRAALKGQPSSVIARSTPAAPLDFAVDSLDGVNAPGTEWNFENPGEPAPPPAPRRERRRGLLDWLFNWDGDEDEGGDGGGGGGGGDDDGRQHRSRNRELAPRAVQSGDGQWTRVPRTRPNPPPADAAIPPPDTPPPE
jgi:penicillin-binding protein 1A